MNARNRISVTARNRPSLQAGLVASIGLLRMGTDELGRFLDEQAAQNPALVLERPPVTVAEVWPRWRGLGTGPAADLAETATAATPSLMAHVVATVDRLFPQGPARRIALDLAEALEPSGWLPATAVTGDEALAVLAALQAAGPAGLFARGLSECLRLQAVDQGVLDPVLSCMIDHLDLLAGGQTARLARICAVPEGEVLSRLRLIRSFDPKPGTQFAALPRLTGEPELILRCAAGGCVIAANPHALPVVSVDAGGARHAVAGARLIRRMVAQRSETLLRVAGAMAARQAGRLVDGLVDAAPMTMAEVAADLGLHPSSVSRVVAGTAIDTPWGVRPLRELFGGDAGGGLSAVALRERIALAIAAEDRARPLTDDDLAARLSLAGVSLSRRTVAKYRAMLHIPPAHRRRAFGGKRG